MNTAFTPLAAVPLGAGCGYHRPGTDQSQSVSIGDRAMLVMTDLRRVRAVTVSPNMPIDGANERMIAHGVRLLLVCDARDTIQGIVTAADILGEKPMLFMQRFGGERGDINVGDIMTAADEIDALKLSDVATAKVGDIVATLTAIGRQHAIVVDGNDGRGHGGVCGIFSANQIGKQLGIHIEPADIARTFAELQRIINS